MSNQTKSTEIKVLCVGGVQPAISILAPRFEQVSGYKVSVTYVSPGGALRDRVLSDQTLTLPLFPHPSWPMSKGRAKLSLEAAWRSRAHRSQWVFAPKRPILT